MSKTTLDAKYVSCATCKFWSGQTEYQYPGNVLYDQDNTDGACHGMYMGGTTKAYSSCIKWEQRFNSN